MVREMRKVATTFVDGFFWNNFKSMEQDFLRFLEYTPYCVMNDDMYSPKLTGLLLQIGGYIDSAFKEMARFFTFTEVKSYKIKRSVLTEKLERKAVKNIIDYCAVFEGIYELSNNSHGDLIAKLDFGLQHLRPLGSLQMLSLQNGGQPTIKSNMNIQQNFTEPTSKTF